MSSEPLGLSAKYPANHRFTGWVVIEHPGCEAHWGILKAIQSLRAVTHLLRVAEAVLVEEIELIIWEFLLRRERGWLYVVDKFK